MPCVFTPALTVLTYEVEWIVSVPMWGGAHCDPTALRGLENLGGWFLHSFLPVSLAKPTGDAAQGKKGTTGFSWERL